MLAKINKHNKRILAPWTGEIQMGVGLERETEAGSEQGHHLRCPGFCQQGRGCQHGLRLEPMRYAFHGAEVMLAGVRAEADTGLSHLTV